MPSAIQYIPPTDVERGGFNPAISKEFQRRKDTYVTALNYYKGDGKDPIEPDESNPDYNPDDDNTQINLVKMAADRTTSFLFPALPDIQIDRTSIEPTPEERWLKEKFLKSNGGLPALIKWALRGFLAGHTYVWVKNAKPVPKMVVLHPLSVTVFWAADDINDILWYEQRYVNGNYVYIRDFIHQEDGTWLIVLYKGENKIASNAEKILEQITNYGHTTTQNMNFDSIKFGDRFTEVSRTAHKSVIPPIIDVAHLPDPDDYYGMAEFTDTNLLDKINKVASLRSRIIRMNSEPTDVITGADLDDIEGDGAVVTIPQAGAKVTRLSLTSDLNAVNSTLMHLMEVFLGVMRVVILKGEAKDLQRVTNAAVRTLFLDALAKNEVLWAAYSTALEKIFRLALVMAYGNGEPTFQGNPIDKPIQISMKSPLPVDLTEIANINALAKDYRSQHTASVSIGDDPVFETAMLEIERKRNLEHQREQLELMQELSDPPQPDQNNDGGSNDVKNSGG